MKIQTKKGDKCTICRRNIVPPNCWVRYHIKYSPEMVILACRHCNYIEKCLRTGIPVPFNRRSVYNFNRLSRAECVIDFMRKFDVTY